VGAAYDTNTVRNAATTVSNVRTTLASLPIAETPVTPTGEPLTVTVKLAGTAVVAAIVSLYVRVKIVPEAPNTALLITGGIGNGVTAFDDGDDALDGTSPLNAVDVNV
jgi:hypothetical protein